MTRPVVTQSPAEGWIPWTGGENPVPGQRVEVRYRTGAETCGASDHFLWTHWPTHGDIIAYRPVQSDAPCYECGSTERMGTACAPCNPEITDPTFGQSDAPAEQGGSREKAARAVYAARPARMLHPEERELSWEEAQEDCPDRIATIYRDVDAILAALQAAPAEASLESLKRSRDVANYRAHQLVRTLLEVKDSIETYPLDDTATCMCGSPVEGHNVASGHAPVSQADHAISLIVGDINKALGLANTPDDALGTGRPDDYEGPDAGMHDTEVVDDESDDLHEIEDAAK